MGGINVHGVCDSDMRVHGRALAARLVRCLKGGAGVGCVMSQSGRNTRFIMAMQCTACRIVQAGCLTGATDKDLWCGCCDGVVWIQLRACLAGVDWT